MGSLKVMSSPFASLSPSITTSTTKTNILSRPLSYLGVSSLFLFLFRYQLLLFHINLLFKTSVFMLVMSPHPMSVLELDEVHFPSSPFLPRPRFPLSSSKLYFLLLSLALFSFSHCSPDVS